MLLFAFQRDLINDTLVVKESRKWHNSKKQHQTGFEPQIMVLEIRAYLSSNFSTVGQVRVSRLQFCPLSLETCSCLCWQLARSPAWPWLVKDSSRRSRGPGNSFRCSRWVTIVSLQLFRNLWSRDEATLGLGLMAQAQIQRKLIYSKPMLKPWDDSSLSLRARKKNYRIKCSGSCRKLCSSRPKPPICSGA